MIAKFANDILRDTRHHLLHFITRGSDLVIFPFSETSSVFFDMRGDWIHPQEMLEIDDQFSFSSNIQILSGYHQSSKGVESI